VGHRRGGPRPDDGRAGGAPLADQPGLRARRPGWAS
jgi:hypothetical protein